MAKIKIKNYTELIEVSQSTAKQLRDFLTNRTISRDEMISVGNFTTRKADLVSIFLDEELNQEGKYDAQVREYYKHREQLLELDPITRAERTSWGHFCLFYWAIYKTKPDILFKEKIIQPVAEFYKANPNWTKPSMMIWYQFLKLPKDALIDKYASSVLERVEQRQIQDIQESKKYQDKQSQLEKQEVEAIKKVEEDLPF